MKTSHILVLLLLLIPGVTLSAVYKWVDEAGRVHYGDAPPEGAAAETVVVPEGPSEAEVGRAREQMKEKMRLYEKFSDQASPPKPSEEVSRNAERPVVVPNHVACGSPIFDLVKGPSAKSLAPISPTALNKDERRSLHGLFNTAKGRWRGSIIESTCLDGASDRNSGLRSFKAEATVEWNPRGSQLLIDTDTFEKETGITRGVAQLFEVGDALYFSDTSTPGFNKTTDTIAREGNKVEILALDRDLVSFLIKRRIPTGLGTRIPRAEVRQLMISGRTLKFMELHYHNDALTGSSAWVLSR